MPQAQPQGRHIPGAQGARQQSHGQGRRGSTRGSEQPPWRSSLDLVWSYSRSQAFYGQNISTSPSFVERHWARRRLEGEREEDSASSSQYDGESYDEDFDEEDEDAELERDQDWTEEERDSFSEADEDGEEDGAAERWRGERLPQNSLLRAAPSQQDGNAADQLQHKRRMSSTRARTAALAARNRRLRSLADDSDSILEAGAAGAGLGGSAVADDDGDTTASAGRENDRRGRSRSRSPKRLTSSRSREARGSFGSARRDAQGPLMRAGRLPSPAKGFPAERLTPADERTPLLNPPKAPSRRASADLARRKSAMLRRESSQSHLANGPLGASTFLQSWFNTLNALIGVGILALPLAFSYAGWVLGPLLFLLAGLLTNYTGKTLASIMARAPGLRTYADIGSYAFGPRARLAVSALFCLELWAVCVALIILFADSAQSVLPLAGASINAYKALGLALILPTIFLPLNLLSPVSVIGIVSTFTLFAVVLSDGLIKKTAPGSLWEPGPTSIRPQWERLPLAFGLIMSGFSSHPVIPSLVKDMRHPAHFGRMLDLAYIAATCVYMGMGAVGYAMFGRNVSDEITRDLARTAGFPRVLNKVAIWLIVVNPLAKFALAARPINTTVEVLFGVEPSQVRAQARRRRDDARRKSTSSATVPDLRRQSSAADANAERSGMTSSSSGASLANGNGAEVNPLAGSHISVRAAELSQSMSPKRKTILRVAIRIVIACLVTVTAIVLPGFEKVMAFLGAFLAFATCVFGPLLANLKLFHRELSWTRIALDVSILVLSLGAAATGTAWAFLPNGHV